MTMLNKHWGLNDLKNGYANIYSPTVHEGIRSFKLKRQVFKQFMELENYLRNMGFKGWISYTELINPNIMKMFTKLKAVPYGINIKKETIWFRKEF